MFKRAPAGAPLATPPMWPHVQAPPHSHIPPLPPAYTPIPYAPTAYPPVPLNIYQPTPHSAYGRGGRQRRTRGQGRGGQTRNGGQSYAPMSTAPPPYGGTRPASNMTGRTNSTTNPNKNYNNWNMCVFVWIWHHELAHQRHLRQSQTRTSDMVHPGQCRTIHHHRKLFQQKGNSQSKLTSEPRH